MNGNDFVESIMEMPLATSMRVELESADTIEDMKSEWNNSTTDEKKVWLVSLKLECLTDYINEFGSLPDRFASLAFDSCVDAVRNMSLQSSVGGSLLSYHILLPQIRKIGLGVTQSKGLVESHTYNSFINSLSEQALAHDQFLYNVMVEVFDDDNNLEQMVSHYTNSLADCSVQDLSDIQASSITRALDITFDKLFHPQKGAYNVTQQIQKAINPNPINKILIIGVALLSLWALSSL